MCPHVTVKLTEIPHILRQEYHPDQVELYAKWTELTFKALTLPSVMEFMENLASTLMLDKVEVLVNRLPARRSRISLFEKEGKPHISIEVLRGIAFKKRNLIIVWPDLLWPIKHTKPFGLPGIRGFILNSSIRAIIHEMLHRSSVHDEAEARRLTDQHYEEFRRTHLSRFEQEFKPILKEWKKTEKAMGL